MVATALQPADHPLQALAPTLFSLVAPVQVRYVVTAVPFTPPQQAVSDTALAVVRLQDGGAVSLVGGTGPSGTGGGVVIKSGDGSTNDGTTTVRATSTTLCVCVCVTMATTPNS